MGSAERLSSLKSGRLNGKKYEVRYILKGAKRTLHRCLAIFPYKVKYPMSPLLSMKYFMACRQITLKAMDLILKYILLDSQPG